jgi:23S rRNA-/tRNA-specific pseudouridylate synthase
LNQRFVHYLSQANPIRQPKDLVTGILNNIIYHDEQIIVFNKPPGVMVLGIKNIHLHIYF